MKKPKLKVVVVGATGRMGQEICELLSESSLEIVGKIGKSGEDVISDISKLKAQADVVIDFSTPELLAKIANWCEKNETPLVSGTTGFAKAEKSQLEKLSKKVPVLWAPNMSLGIAILSRLIENLSEMWPQADYQIEELHHRNKKDIPSGTALSLQEVLEKKNGLKLKEPVSIRGGGIFGIHKLWAMGEEETITIEHTALNRRVFAKGAIQAAQWIVGQRAGMYTIQDVLKGN
jgi:4-hydroxy-tetrahydrodipicolinate reductase